jgi:hypothetical protein
MPSRVRRSLRPGNQCEFKMAHGIRLQCGRNDRRAGAKPGRLREGEARVVPV